MKAQYVFENINFQRGMDPRGSMSIGGFSFDTLRPGALLQSKKYYGVTRTTGKIGGYHSSAIQISKGDWLLVINVRDQINGKKNISFRRYHHAREVMAREDRIEFLKTGKIPFGFSRDSGFFDHITKRTFDYRLDIVEPGFLVNESISFKRGQDPKRTMKIGERNWNNLIPGDILIPKKEIRVSSKGEFKPPSYKSGKIYYPQDYIVIVTYKNGVVDYNHRITMGYKMHLHRSWNLEEALNIRSMIENGSYGMPRENDIWNRPAQGSYEQWKNRFDIYEG